VLGCAARERLTAQTGLSRAGVDLAIELCLEAHPSQQELTALCASVTPSKRSHVLLSANAFVAAHRAIALALAASPNVFVRASRREPEMARFLHEASHGCFELVEALEPTSRDQLFAFGSDQTLATVRSTLPTGVRCHSHGMGFGLLLVQASALPSESKLFDLANVLVRDVVLFDQRGCLSPRTILFEGDQEAARGFARALQAALEAWSSRVPRGALSAEEQQELTSFRQTLRYAGDFYDTNAGAIGVLGSAVSFVLPPTGRHLLVQATADALAPLNSLARYVTTFGYVGTEAFRDGAAAALPQARIAQIGELQRPAFDGPVDRRGAGRAR